jgi:hypothetical protein
MNARQGPLISIRSKRGAWRRRNSIVRACYQDARGGTQYGIDWPTLVVTWPDRASELRALKAMFGALPD